MTSIITKYIGATNTKPSRIIADAGMGRRVTIAFPHDTSDPHRAAVIALCEKFDWHGTLAEGGTTTGSVFVFVDSRDTFTV